MATNEATAERVELTPEGEEKLRLLDMARRGELAIMDSTQVGAYLQFSPRTIRAYQATKGLPSHQTEERGEHRFFRDEVDQWLRLRTVGVDVLTALDAVESLVVAAEEGGLEGSEALPNAVELLAKAGRG